MHGGNDSVVVTGVTLGSSHRSSCGPLNRFIGCGVTPYPITLKVTFAVRVLLLDYRSRVDAVRTRDRLAGSTGFTGKASLQLPTHHLRVELRGEPHDACVRAETGKVLDFCHSHVTVTLWFDSSFACFGQCTKEIIDFGPFLTLSRGKRLCLGTLSTVMTVMTCL